MKTKKTLFLLTLSLSTVSLIGCGKPKEYNVTFKYNCTIGSVSESTYVVKDGEKTPVPTVIRSAYDFGGWFFDNTTFLKKFNTEKPITEDTVVYAKWTENEWEKFLSILDTNAGKSTVTYSKVSGEETVGDTKTTFTDTTIEADGSFTSLSGKKVQAKLSRKFFEDNYGKYKDEINKSAYFSFTDTSTGISFTATEGTNKSSYVYRIDNDNYFINGQYVLNDVAQYKFMKPLTYSA